MVPQIAEPKAEEPRYSFTLRDADVREILLSLARQTPYNIVVDPDVTGTVTIDLKEVTLMEALDLTTDMLNLTYRVQRNIIRVSLPKPETRIFSLNYILSRRAGTSTTSATIGGAGGITGAAGGGVAGGGAAGGAAGGASLGGGTQNITTTDESDVWGEVESGIKGLLSPQGKVVINKQAASIIVTDLPRNLEQVASFLEAVEGSTHRQVLIEAKIIEVTLNDEFRWGLNWQAIGESASLAALGVSGALPGKFLLAQDLSPDTGTFQFGVSGFDFNILLDAMAKQGDINIISSPKVSTLNNQRAIIKVGRDEVFFRTEVAVLPIAATIQEVRQEVIQTFTVGVILGVIPQIASDDVILMHIHPTVTEKAGVATSPEGRTAPILDVRETDTMVRVKDGETIVIAGLMQEKETNNPNKVPFVGDVPVLGHFFRQTIQEKRKTELVILIRPRILVGKRIEEISAEAEERIRRLRR